MLESIDILIGLALVMLVASLATMLVTQSLIALFRRRAAHLLAGVTDLLNHLDASISRSDAGQIAQNVLKHPMVRGSTTRPATVIKREELLKLLFELALPRPEAPDTSTPRLEERVRAILARVLRENGIDDPARTLSNVRMLALELERSHPEMAFAARQTLAITQEAYSEFVAKVNAWFDHTMDRVSERFTVSSRAFTFLSALALVLVTQLDTIAVINRLATDQPIRDALVREAVRLDAQAVASNTSPSLPEEEQRRLVRVMADAGILRVPREFDAWWAGWGTINPWGAMLSVLLLSLGAPFWFNALSSLLRLRSVVAQKDDADRAERQRETSKSTMAAAGRTSGARDGVDGPSATAAVGERGDLTAVG